MSWRAPRRDDPPEKLGTFETVMFVLVMGFFFLSSLGHCWQP